VNKFSSGEPNYRDSTFFPHWVQLNWQNGFDQEFFEDGGKFYRSANIDITNTSKLTLERNFSSAGLAESGADITSQEIWRSSGGSSYFGDGSDGALTISANTTEAPIDSACTGSSGSTTLSATNASFAAGQKVFIHQTQGTGAGNRQFNKIISYSTGTITLETALNAAYVTGAQVRVMKQYTTVTIDSGKTYTAKAWNGTVGGILAYYANTSTTVTGSISASGVTGLLGDSSSPIAGASTGGFRGGDLITSASKQGESSTGVGSVSTAANGNGGGGATGADASNGGGGGGGGHATAGGNGRSVGTGVGGTGGGTVGAASLSTIFFGGAGGGGNSGDTGNDRSGSSGGGIIIAASLAITVTGSIVSNGGSDGSEAHFEGGGGAGGSIWIQAQTATLGTGLITASGGTGFSGTGNGGSGRIHIDYLTSYTGTTTPTLDATQDGTLSSSVASTTPTHIVGTSTGKIYSWDGVTTYTELFDARRIEWFETGTNLDRIIGDQAATERAQSQSFQVTTALQMKAVSVNLKKNAGTPGNITVRIETNNAGVPSGTLVDATNATATITAFTTATYGWITVEFPAAFSLAATTTYWIVLKTAAAANDQNYAWASKSTSGYSSGNVASSADGGSTWTAAAGEDAYFRLLGSTTSVNCMLYSDITATGKLYIGTGNPEGTTAGNARLYTYDGTNFVLSKIFAGTNEATIGAMAEYGTTTRTVYIGLGSKAKIYTSTDMSAFTLSKTITVPRNPGYILAMAEYNNKLYVGGGFPENLPGTNNQFGGFLYSYDEFSWVNVFPFDHTVITALETYDTLLFIGTIKKRLYVFNTASIDKLLDFPWDVTIKDMTKWDDKLVLTISARAGASTTGNEGVYLFDRSGFHNAFSVSGKEWVSALVFNNNLMAGSGDGYIYQTSFTTYQSTGNLQTSYDEASLPSIYKIRRSVTLMYESLPTGCSILVEYKTDESDASWTTLGTASTVASTEATFNFASGVYSKKISYKYTLATSVPASTPTLKKALHKYVLSPDFKYMWKMKLLCIDDMIWQDGTEPAGLLNADISAGVTSITLKSSADATPTAGFPDPSGSTMYASIITPSTGAIDTFSYTGKSGTTLTGIPSSGTYALASHSAGDYVKILGRDFHQVILDLKQTRQLYTYTDIDGLTFTVLFHSYQADVWAINQDDYSGGLENEVPIQLLEA
ncbi:hypothetical protein M0R04_12675, partial [Candidatus Dojkabacteria bacterium]|nr:hypothetical protein [Candidatus Dojkabacteria bacterium]